MIPSAAIPTIHPQVAARPIEDAELLLLADAGEVLVLNPAGALVWQQLETGASVEQIAAALAGRYTLDAARAQADVTALLAALLEAGAIESSAA